MAYTQSNNILGNRIQDLNIGAPLPNKMSFCPKVTLTLRNPAACKTMSRTCQSFKEKKMSFFGISWLWGKMVKFHSIIIPFEMENYIALRIEEGYLGLQAVP